MRRHITLLLLTLSTYGVQATEVCDQTSSKCAQIGSASAWLLSIIETSMNSCPPSNTVDSWFQDNQWLAEKIKSQEPQYNYLIEMQLKTFWDSNNPDFLSNCLKVEKQVGKVDPLNEELR